MKRKTKKYKFVYLVFLTLLYFGINFNLKNKSFEQSNEEFVNSMLQNSNYHFVSKDKNIIDNVFEIVSDIDVTQPVSIIDKVFAYQEAEQIQNIQQFSYIQNIVVDNPRVYIYSTHPEEGYSNTDFNVVTASLLLQEKLNSYGIQTIVESRNATQYIKDNNLKNNYSATKQFLKDAVNNYKNLELIIDLHRDSVPIGVSTTTEINGKKYAKVMFVMNVNYPNYKIAQNINKIMLNKYPTISRGMYDKYDDAYNQELNSKLILIELGSKFNTREEVINTINILAEAIKEQLNER